MDVKDLMATSPSEWPSDASTSIFKTLLDKQAPASDRLMAAELAGDLCAMNEDLADAMLAVLRDRRPARRHSDWIRTCTRARRH